MTDEDRSEAEATDPGKERVEIIDSSDGIRDALHHAAEAGLPVAVLSTEHMEVARGTFKDLGPKSLQIRLEPASETFRLRTLSVICVSFNFKNRNRVFVTQVWSFQRRRAPAASRLVIGAPRQIMATDCRMAFRVPVLPDVGLRVSLAVPDGRYVPVTPIDLSLTGILVDLGDGAPRPGLDADEPVSVRIEHAGATLDLDGAIARAIGTKRGVFFPSVFRDGELAPPLLLQRMIRALEQRWLRNRTDLPAVAV